MTPVLSRAEARALDRLASDEHGIPSLTLMENAGRGAAAIIVAEFPGARGFTIVCGAGNNGGDGFVVARELVSHGRTARVLLVADESTVKGDARVNLLAWKQSGGAVERIGVNDLTLLEQALSESDVAVDALFGTGLSRELQGLERSVVEALDRAKIPCACLDLPSGLDADRGVPLGVAVRAKVTMTFAHEKRGLLTPLGAELSGRVHVVDIGIPAQAVERAGVRAQKLEEADVARCFEPRTRLSHKGSSGRVLVIAGSPGKVGAALLVAHGALRTGAGLVTLAARPALAQALETRVLEAMTARIDEASPEASLLPLLAQTDTVVIGPGLGFDDLASRLIEQVLTTFSGRVVVDADAITHFRGRAADLAGTKASLLVTPHPGELGRLLGTSTAEVESDRFGAVERAAELTGATVLLKGAPTLVAERTERIAVCPSGHPVLAAGGSGDVLSGCLGAILVSNDPYRAACAGAFVHGRAAESLAAERGVDRGVLAHEVADRVPVVIAGLSRERPFVSG